METVQFIYKDQPVDFQPAGKDNVMVNATQMADLFGKEIKRFNELESTKDFIEACLNYREKEVIEGKISREKRLIGIEKREDLIISVQNSGTWMHRILALKFAAWLDPNFEVWVFVTIDRIINHYFREQRDAMIEKLSIKAKKEALRNELIAKHPEIAEYFELEDQEKSVNARRAAIMREQMKQLQIDFSATSKIE